MRSMRYFFQEARRSLLRNRYLSLATISTAAICIFILGTAFLLVLNTNNFINRLENDLEVVAFLDKTLPEDTITQIGKDIAGHAQVESISLISKDEALLRMNEKYAAEGASLAETLGENPFPDSYEIKVKNPQDVQAVAADLGQIPGVYRVNYGQGLVERLFNVTTWVRYLSMGIILLLLLGAIFLIATNVRLSIFARRKEIYLMKLVGAKDWFIKLPFYLEGIILGLVGALLAVAILALAYSSLLDNWQTSMAFIPLIDDRDVLLKSHIGLSGIGMLLGVIGTSISINRFLDV